jgi:hypothetical protein
MQSKSLEWQKRGPTRLPSEACILGIAQVFFLSLLARPLLRSRYG